jgi:hypothetical protein
MGEIEPLRSQVLDSLETERRVAIHECSRQIVEDTPARNPEDSRDVFSGKRFAAERDHLVEKTHRVSHRSGGFAGERGDREVVGDDILLGENLP